ncbi:alpha/beta hydrolase [Palleronia sp.]|uniref:alpha/beta hydrolase n=1 Tax=Palleronia sp. TaxID=1940284 RepID=UPI0035C84B18
MGYDAIRSVGTADHLVFTFHGTGATADQLHGLARTLLPKAHVVSPQGDVHEGDAPRFFRRKAEGVYDMDDLAQRVEKMGLFVRGEITRTGVSHVTGIGYSNGANILAATAIRYPRLFDTLVLMHPLIPWVPAPEPGLAAKRILVTGGRQDPICPAELTQGLADWFTAQMADCTLAWHPGGHEIQQTEIDCVADFLC